MFTCTDTASAPNWIAFSTLVTVTLLFGSGLNEVLADKCTIRPMSLPYPLCPSPTIPLCINIAFAPPWEMLSTVSSMLIIPLIGPLDTPWSIGAITVLPVFLLKILSKRIFFPISVIRLVSITLNNN